MPILENIKFTISREDVYRLLKFARAKTQSTPKVEALIEAEIKEGYALAEPRAIYETYSISKREKDSILLEGCSLVIKSRDVAERLAKSPKLSFFACTIGRALPDKVNEYMRLKETTRAAILDAVGSEAVEGVANSVNEAIVKGACGEECKLLPRFSPGYGDWELVAEEEVLKLLKAERVGITLSPSYIMVPEKSITAVVGWVVG
ncbi:MAG: vitamin B12 dependent-methionine synthase activation domain-containing protein [Candidatus Omnitrophica bacterium]|nr:vitamin B12 dependent-methionine synthase activation domain-containing protein [Candidatus Omnitrophota bacterium]